MNVALCVRDINLIVIVVIFKECFVTKHHVLLMNFMHPPSHNENQFFHFCICFCWKRHALEVSPPNGLAPPDGKSWISHCNAPSENRVFQVHSKLIIECLFYEDSIFNFMFSPCGPSSDLWSRSENTSWLAWTVNLSIAITTLIWATEVIFVILWFGVGQTNCIVCK